MRCKYRIDYYPDLLIIFPFSYYSSGHPHGQRRKRQSQGPDNRISYTETHIPLQKGIDDCIDDHANNSTGTVMTPMLAEHERNPDIIPINSRDSSKCKTSDGSGSTRNRVLEVKWRNVFKAS